MEKIGKISKIGIRQNKSSPLNRVVNRKIHSFSDGNFSPWLLICEIHFFGRWIWVENFEKCILAKYIKMLSYSLHFKSHTMSKGTLGNLARRAQNLLGTVASKNTGDYLEWIACVMAIFRLMLSKDFSGRISILNRFHQKQHKNDKLVSK